MSISRDGSICLHNYPVFGYDTLKTASEILNSSRLIENTDALADNVVSFSSNSLASGLYWIYGFDKYGIVSGPITINVLEDPGVSIREMVYNPPEIDLFPNPAKEILTVQTSIPNRYDIAITALNGQLLYSNKMEGPYHQIDLSSFQKGLYFITIRSRDFVRTEKIIKL